MRELAIEFYKRGIVKLGRFILSSGIESPFYIDLRVMYSHPDLMKLIVKEAVDKVKSEDYETLVGVATSGIALAAYIASHMSKPMAYVRVERKDHGTRSFVEGDVTGRKALIVDDVATTGESLERAFKALVEVGARPKGVLVVVDRCQGAQKRVDGLGLKYHYLTTAEEIFETLVNEGYIDATTYRELTQYIRKYQQV
ncbi:MAG: orotate phosphoribosyltransferase [Zestosphaera tikiterensis]|uniref:Orotate phosphoribosyltransferase n=1 Tax=Zestosphaera tikiterensis TaxID=1973259 RepID=A0A2R7Y930_9CREN|nr:MAG: orotate phosphoribosyltransferase [Zestosphaera tikiterensis]